MRALLRLYPLYRPFLGWMALSIFLSVIAALAGAGLMAVSGWFITAMAVAGASSREINYYTPSALVRLFAILRTAARYAERVVGHDATLRVVAEARFWLFSRLVPLGPATMQDLRSGEVLARLKGDIDRLETAFLRLLAPLATAAISLGAVFLFLLRFDKMLAFGFALLGLGSGFVLPALLARINWTVTASAARLLGERRSRLVDDLDGLADLSMTCAAAQHFEEARKAFDRQLRLESREQASVARTQAALSFAGDGALIAALMVGAASVAANKLSAPDMTMLALIISAGFEPMLVLPGAFAGLPSTVRSLNRILDLADRQPTVAEAPDPKQLATNLDIEFDDVSFAYPGVTHPVLSHVSICIPEGTTVAIVGASGSGKSTFAELLLRLRDPTQGVVRIGGVKVTDLSLQAFRSLFAVAPQFPHLFDRSIAENLRLSDPTADDVRMIDALGVSQLAGFFAGLPEGLRTTVGPLGAKLSAGQARRMAIARAAISRAPIMVLDEPTEGLDPENERKLIDTLFSATSGRTLILVTHSDYLTSRVDRVLKVKGGSVCEVR